MDRQRTLLLAAGDSRGHGTLLSVPGGPRALQQVWLSPLAVDCPPVESGRAQKREGCGLRLTCEPGNTLLEITGGFDLQDVGC